MGKEELKILVENLKSNIEVNRRVQERLKQFMEKNSQEDRYWFEELCFCILTANSSAKKGIEIQNYLTKIDGFRKLNQTDLSKVLERMGHRFFQKRAEFIIEARKYQNIKEIITSFTNELEAVEWLVNNVKGLGYKESNHFLRNVGYSNVAILDRHILRILNENKMINEIPKSLTKKKYKEIEKIIFDLANEMKVVPSEMDLYLWYSRTGEVLK